MGQIISQELKDYLDRRCCPTTFTYLLIGSGLYLLIGANLKIKI